MRIRALLMPARRRACPSFILFDAVCYTTVAEGSLLRISRFARSCSSWLKGCSSQLLPVFAGVHWSNRPSELVPKQWFRRKIVNQSLALDRACLDARPIQVRVLAFGWFQFLHLGGSDRRPFNAARAYSIFLLRKRNLGNASNNASFSKADLGAFSCMV